MAAAFTPVPGRREPESAARPGKVAAALAAVVVLLAVAAVGATSVRGAGSSQLNRSGTSIVLSVFTTLVVLFAVAAFTVLIIGLVTGRRHPERSTERTRPRLVAAAVVLAMLAGCFYLLSLSAKHRQVRTFAGSAAAPQVRGQVGGTIRFDPTASAATVGVVVIIGLVLGLVALWRAVAWRRAASGFASLGELADDEAAAGDDVDEVDRLNQSVERLSVADPADEPDPRRAVVRCYLQLLAAAEAAGSPRRPDETPAEFLARMLERTGVSPRPVTRLTELFERARYSKRPVDESVRTEATDALAEIHREMAAAPAHVGGRRA